MANNHIYSLLEKNKYAILIREPHEIHSHFLAYYLEFKKNQLLIQRIPSLITYLIQQPEPNGKLSTTLIQMFQLLTAMNINSMVRHSSSLQELAIKENIISVFIILKVSP